MASLEEKYKYNSLTQEELFLLREKLNTWTDKQVEAELYDEWQKDTWESDMVSDERLKSIKEKVDKARTTTKHSLGISSRLGWIAAAVLLPAFIITTLHLYRVKTALANEEVLFFAQEGERANVTLPDGTNVTLNSSSSLTYSPGSFNHKERTINFNGEGYFDVATNPSIPFFIHTKDMNVKVLGTKFNLRAYAKDETISLTLEEGHVLLSSRKEEKEVFPHQKAILNCQNGSISIVKEEVPEDASAWRNSELAFSNQELQHVLTTLERNYGVRICIKSCDNLSADLFTGKIPSNNLLDALEILKYSYRMKYRIDNKTIYFSSK